MQLQISTKLENEQKLWSSHSNSSQKLECATTCGTCSSIGIGELDRWFGENNSLSEIMHQPVHFLALPLFAIFDLIIFMRIRLNLARFRQENEENGAKQKMAHKRGPVAF